MLIKGKKFKMTNYVFVNKTDSTHQVVLPFASFSHVALGSSAITYAVHCHYIRFVVFLARNFFQLVTERIQLADQWTERWETLQLLLEVYQFARDAEVADAWLMAQEPYLASKDLGETLDETLALLKKHLAFERAAATQEERFLALQKLTTVSCFTI